MSGYEDPVSRGQCGTGSRWICGAWAATAATAYLLIVSAPALQAQELMWSRTYGGGGTDGAFALETTADGGIVLAGFAGPFGAVNASIIKTDDSGNPIWSRTYGGPMNDYGRSVREIEGGGYVVAGYFEENSQTHDAYLIRTDSSGNVLWERRYDLGDDERAHSVCTTADGGFLLAGQAWIINGPFGSYDFWVIKTDGAGNVQWQRTYAYESFGNDVALSAEQTNDGGYVIAGFTQSTGWDAYVIRTDPLGVPIWERTFGLGYSDESYSVQPLADGTFIIAGVGTPGGGDGDVLLARLAANGDSIWIKTYGGPQDDLGQSVRETADGGFVVTGMTASFGAGQWDIWVLRTDAVGDTLWTRTFGGEWDDRGHGVRPVPGGILVAGWAWSFGAGSGDAYLLKLEDGATTAADAAPGMLPFFALRVLPNPTPGPATLDLDLGDEGTVRIAILDVAGRRVRGLADGSFPAGRHTLAWDGRDEAGRPVASGVYFARVLQGGREGTKRLTVVR